MGKFGKSFLSQVISDGIKGPFVTIMLNTHVGHQNVEKDQIKFKNFAKDAKRRFEKKYPEHSWDLFQTKIDELLASCKFIATKRPSYTLDLTTIQQHFKNFNITLLETPELEISSTDIRQRIKKGYSIQYITTEQVQQYIRKEELYL